VSTPVIDRRTLPRDMTEQHRASRFKAALERARKIVAAEPPLTAEQLRAVAQIFHDAASS
jgi:hypothetical protein